MDKGKFIFAQYMSFLPNRIFDTCVNRYNGNSYVKHFSCWNQLSAMIFGQLGNIESIRGLVLCINSHSQKSYHLGFGKNVSRNNLSNANEKRDWRIFADFAYVLIAEAQKICKPVTDFKLDIDANIYAFDASIIDLCLNVFWWATYKKTKAAIKLHTLIDVAKNIPIFIHITEGALHDVHGMDLLNYEPNSYYVFDRGYVDFKRLYTLHQKEAFFVIRGKKNLKFKRLYSNKCEKDKGVRCDQTIILTGFYVSKWYPEKLRRIKYYDEETKITFVFLTNNFTLSALEIALIYKYRWQVELFFKWLKQHLKVKKFWGTSENAVKIQIFSAIITYTTVAIIKEKLNSSLTNYKILQILNISLLDKTPLNELITKPYIQNVKEQDYNQLKLFEF
jgi:hypothetical protein